MKTKHTPGPWTVEVGQTETCIESKYQTIALDVSNCDADLIAAAPEMLEALEEASKLLAQISTKTGMSFFSVGGMIDGVIRKARGDV